MYSPRLVKDLEAQTPIIPDIQASVVIKAAEKAGWEVEEIGASYFLKYQENESYICFSIPKEYNLQVFWMIKINHDLAVFEPRIRYQSRNQKGSCCIDAEADLLAILKIKPQDVILPESVIPAEKLPVPGWVTSEEGKGGIFTLSCYTSEVEEMWGKVAQHLAKLVQY